MTSACAFGFQRSTIRETKDPRRIRRTHLHDSLEIDQSGVYEIERQTDRRFQPVIPNGAWSNSSAFSSE